MQVQQTPGLAPLPMQMQVPMPVMIQPGMMMVAQAQVPMERADLPGERTVLSQTGGTRLQNTKSIKIEYNAEIRQPGCCEKLALSFATCCCLSFDTERSYLYVRENSIEANTAFNMCCECSTCTQNKKFDRVKVMYFDNDPFKPNPSAGCGCCPYDPKLEVIDSGCMIFCVKVCSDKSVVFMPFEKYCCCQSNRVAGCDNWCGCCGGITGNPKIYFSFYPQPANAQAFVDVCQPVQKACMERL
ncbi:hypothetical protein ScalyP_jg3917 [Parmales sp. scaly parma]|nr:hypothetical protein ScalyP_jg3917 [Parmales sp. scaly parma]